MTGPRPDSTERVTAFAREMGLAIDVVEFPDGTRTASDAAAAVDCLVDQIVKSMIFDADGELVLALTSGANQVDPAKLAECAGVTSCGRADVNDVRRHTGFAIGGVPPFGHDNPTRSWLDPHLESFDVVWAAAGTPRHVFPIKPATLRELTGAIVADFTDSR